MDVEVALSRAAVVPASADDIVARLSDIPWTLSHFPKLKPVTALKPGQYRWDLETIGAAGVEHDVSFATTFDIDVEHHRIAFTEVPGVGNASVSGQFTVQEEAGQTRLMLEVSGTLRDIRVPMLLRAPAKPFIKKLFEDMVDTFAARVEDNFR